MKTYLTIEHLDKAYGTQTIFEDAFLTVHEDQKIGLIGRNGAGKSTLMRIITGEEELDSGTVMFHPGVSIGYLKQQEEFLEGETVLDYLTRSSEKEEWQCGKAAHQFGLTVDYLYREISGLSGGYQMRVKLAAMIAREPNLILLDEPTNYLDLGTVLLLENFIVSFRGSVIVISHDREFLKRTCTETLEVEHGSLTLFPRPLEEYLEHKQVSREVMQKYNDKVVKQKEHLQHFVNRFGATASKAGQAQSKLKQIAKMSTIEIKNPLPTVDISLPKIEYTSGTALRLNNLTVGYGEKKVAEGLTFEIEKGDHVVILGDNGQGKSTLLKTIADVIKPVAGAYRWTPALSIGYFAQNVIEDLNPVDTVLGHLKKYAGAGVKYEDIMRMASNFLFRKDEVEKKISVLSGGEKCRLALATLLLGKNDVLLFDEPTNHLDFETAEALGLALSASNRTVIFISHDRTFVSMLADKMIEIRDGVMREYYGSFQEYVDELIARALEDVPGRKEVRTKNQEVSEDEDEIDSEKERIKEIKKEQKALEVELADLQKDRAKILSDFEKKPEYNPTRNERLKATEAMIKEKELVWVKNQEELDK